jgi:hypothetical protein
MKYYQEKFLFRPFDLTLAQTEANIFFMNKIEESLHEIAENILSLDEASLTMLWEKYKTQAELFSFSPDWEKAVIIFSIINSVRVKNAVFNEQLLNNKDVEKPVSNPPAPGKPYLRLVK